MKTFCRFLMLLIGTSLTGHAVACTAHPDHVSLTEIEWNARTGNFEIAICLWPEDLEKALCGQEHKPINLDSTPHLDQILAGYVEKTFKFQVNNQQVTDLRWVGFESNNKQAWLYFELRPGVFSGEKKICQLQNRLLCELNAEQQNRIHFKNRTLRDVGVCTALGPELAWQFDSDVHVPERETSTNR